MTVARKLGVQLVYTTGLFDPNALSVFPLISGSATMPTLERE